MNSGLKLARFVKPYWRWAALAPLMMLLEVTMDLLQPRLVQRIVDEGIAHLDLSLVIQTGLLMGGLAVIGVFGGMGCAISAETTAQGSAADLRASLFRKVQTFSFSNLDELETGQLIFMTLTAGRSALMDRMCAPSRKTTCVASWAWCSKTTFSLPTRSWRTSVMAG